MTSKKNNSASINEGKKSKKLVEKKKPKRRLRRRLMVALGVMIGLLVALGIYISIIFGWYSWSNRHTGYNLGMSFSADYARALGLDPKEVYMATLDDLEIKRLRLNSYWNNIEPEKGKFNFTELDWEMDEAAARGVEVNLAIGLRQPRWPECHPPKWLDTSAPWSQWKPDMDAYLTTVVERYKNHPALKTYQLENEIYNKVFGDCNNHDKDRLGDEYALVKKLDPNHPIIISRSANGLSPTLSEPRGDVTGISLYRHVWAAAPLNMYFDYPLPPFWYGFEAGQQKMLFGSEAVIHELQTEPWPPNGKFVTHVSLDEQNRTFNAKILRENVEFAKKTNIKTIDLWGVEYWYWRWKTAGDSTVWETARELYANPDQRD